MAEAKFCLNPRGDSPSSGRIFYSIALGCIPILISDPWVTMAEPFDGLLPFGDFATFVDEGEAITKTVVALSARLEALGGIANASADALEKQRRRWRFLCRLRAPPRSPHAWRQWACASCRAVRCRLTRAARQSDSGERLQSSRSQNCRRRVLCA